MEEIVSGFENITVNGWLEAPQNPVHLELLLKEHTFPILVLSQSKMFSVETGYWLLFPEDKYQVSEIAKSICEQKALQHIWIKEINLPINFIK